MSIHVLATPMRVTERRPDGARWCFHCRKRTPFSFVVSVPLDPLSYYGPSGSIRCGRCNTADGDLFPGVIREWSEEER